MFVYMLYIIQCIYIVYIYTHNIYVVYNVYIYVVQCIYIIYICCIYTLYTMYIYIYIYVAYNILIMINTGITFQGPSDLLSCAFSNLLIIQV